MKYTIYASETVYYVKEVEADSLDDAYQKTGELSPGDEYDVIVGDWEECTPNEGEV